MKFSPLAGRTVLLILGWEAFVFSSTVIPFMMTARQLPPLWLLGLLTVIVVLLAMHQAFHWDLPWGGDVWVKLGRSSLPTRLFFGPAVMAGWVIEKVFIGTLLAVAMTLVLPLMLPGLLASLWMERRIRGHMQHLGRWVPWPRVLPLAREGEGLLILEARYEEAGMPWIDLSRLWWVPPAPGLADDPGLPSYRRWLANNFDGEPTRLQCEQGAFDRYQHPDHGRGMLVDIPLLARRHLLQVLATQVPETVVRVTWRSSNS